MPLTRLLATEPRACFRGSHCLSATLPGKARIPAISLESQSTLLYKLGSKSAPSPFPPSLSSFFSIVPLGGRPRRRADRWAGMWPNQRSDPWNGSLLGDAETVDQTKPRHVLMTGARAPVNRAPPDPSLGRRAHRGHRDPTTFLLLSPASHYLSTVACWDVKSTGAWLRCSAHNCWQCN